MCPSNMIQSALPQTGRNRSPSPSQTLGLAPNAQPPRSHTPRSVHAPDAPLYLPEKQIVFIRETVRSWAVERFQNTVTHRTVNFPQIWTFYDHAVGTTMIDYYINTFRISWIILTALLMTLTPLCWETRSTRIWNPGWIACPFLHKYKCF